MQNFSQFLTRSNIEAKPSPLSRHLVWARNAIFSTQRDCVTHVFEFGYFPASGFYQVKLSENIFFMRANASLLSSALKNGCDPPDSSLFSIRFIFH